jgi:hypothetical protein
MDASWMQRIERRQRRLYLLAFLAVGLAVGPFLDWVVGHVRGQTAVTELRVERIVLADSRGSGGGTLELTHQGLKITGSNPQDVTWLSTSSDGLLIRGREGSVWVTPGSVTVQGGEQERIELKHGLVMLLGGKSGQTDIGPGFAAVKGADGHTVIGGRTDGLGLRVWDRKTNETHSWVR